MHSLKNDVWIREMAEKHGMIEPFEPRLVRERDGQRVISYGTSSFGYDLRCAPEFKIFTNVHGVTVDPKNLDSRAFVSVESDKCIIPPNGFILTRSLEYIRMPDNVLGTCLGKSTYARIGLIVNVTPLEPGWQGELVIEVSNTTNSPAIVYANEGICQLIFHEGERPETTYADRGGKYQNQRGITLPRT